MRVRDDARRAVDDWWREVFDIGDDEGWYVAWREGGVHVSAPSTVDVDVDDLASLRDVASVRRAQAPGFEPYATQLAIRSGSSPA